MLASVQGLQVPTFNLQLIERSRKSKVGVSARLSGRPFVRPSVHSSVRPSVCLSVCGVCVCVSLSTFLFSLRGFSTVTLSVCLPGGRRRDVM